MTINLPNTLQDIRNKVRRLTGRPSQNQLSDTDIDKYINTFYVYDLSQEVKLEDLRYNYQFTTSANIPVYDLPTSMYLAAMPPVFIGGYQSYMTQSRQNFFRINPSLNFLQQSVATGNGTAGPYSGVLTNTPITPGFGTNPPGAYSFTSVPLGTNGGPFNQSNTSAPFLNWNVIISAIDANNVSQTLVDDGKGNLVDPTDTANPQINQFPIVRGTVNYLTGAFQIGPITPSVPSLTDPKLVSGFKTNIPSGNAINAQYVPYVASRPQSVVFFQDQFILYPIPDQAYTVSFEVYKYPSAFYSNLSNSTPQVNEWWQFLAVGAALKVFEDYADFDGMVKLKPIYDEYLRKVLRRTITQQTSERVSTIYTEQSQFPQYPFGNLFSGF